MSGDDKEKALIEEGKTIFQKYIDGNYLDKDGVPDMGKAPAALQKETSAWAEKVEKDGYNVDKVIEAVENAFM